MEDLKNELCTKDQALIAFEEEIRRLKQEIINMKARLIKDVPRIEERSSEGAHDFRVSDDSDANPKITFTIAVAAVQQINKQVR